jgi:hypothetical protein
VLRDDTLKAEFAGVLENGRTVARDVLVDLDADAGSLRKEFFEPCSVQNKRPNQINNFTSDQEQYRPYQIVDLLLKIGHTCDLFFDCAVNMLPRKRKMGIAARIIPINLYITRCLYALTQRRPRMCCLNKAPIGSGPRTQRIVSAPAGASLGRKRSSIV